MAESTTMTATNSTFPPSTDPAEPSVLEEPTLSRVFRVILFSLITLASLIGNTMVCKATCKPSSRKPLTYYLVTNLAVAEIISSLCLPFMFAYQYLDEWPFGVFACQLIIPLQVLAMFVVTSTLAAISVYRCVFIVFQPFCKTITPRKTILFLCLLWVIGVAVCLPLFMFHRILTPDEGGIYCHTEFAGDDIYNGPTNNQQMYNIAKFILNFAVPYLVMLVSYGAVALKLKRHISRREKDELFELAQARSSILSTTVEHENEEKNSTGMVQDTETIEAKRRKSSRGIIDLEHDLLRMIYAVILVFVVCYIPYQVHFLFLHFGGYDRFPAAERYSRLIVYYLFLLTSLPSALHPLCYGTMSKFYATSFSKLVLCRNW